MKLPLEPARGTRDILPPDSEYHRELIDRFSEVAELYGYRLIVIPTIEHFEIYEAKSGPGISRSMYVFQDKAGRNLCLRPEFTASIIRAYLKHLTARPKPVKLYYYGQVFRYDEPQFGRYREFYQVGVEYIGEPRLYADVELFQLIRDFYASIGLTSYSFRVNDISVIRGLLERWGVPEEVQDEILHLIDKGEVREAIDLASKYAGPRAGLLESLLEVKASSLEELESQVAKLSIDPEISREGLERLTSLFRILLDLGIRAYVDLRLVRGLAYYTGTIFEVTAPGLNLSIGGGGRYDTLSRVLGGVSIPATGFSLGVERTLLALETEGSLGRLKTRSSRLRVMLISMVDDVKFIDEVSRRMRKKGVVVDVRFTQKHKLSDAMGQASRLGYDYVVIIGEAELRCGKITIKDLRSGTQRALSADSLEDEFPS